MKTMGAYEAKVHWAQILDDVENGETIQITRHGRPVARITAIPAFDPDVAESAARDWIAYRDEHQISFGDVNVRELIEEGRI